MIYTRVDTFSVVLYKTSLNKIFDFLGITKNKNIDFNELYNKGYKSSDVKLGDSFVWSTNGVRFECKLNEFNYYLDNNIIEDDSSVFDFDFDYIRLYISGEGIDFLQNINNDIVDFNLVYHICNLDNWANICSSYNVTRCDFAFDFINIQDDNFNKLREIIATADIKGLSDSGKLSNGRQGGISYSYRGGRERTIYLGSTNSDRLLRIYDKKFQLLDSISNTLDNSKIPSTILDNELSIESWWRIELQTRSSVTMNYLFSWNFDFHWVMGEIKSYFSLKDKEGKYIRPLHSILNWGVKGELYKMQIASNVITVTNQVETYVTSIACNNIKLCIMKNGLSKFIDLINDSGSNIVNSGGDHARRYLNKQNSLISAICLENNITFDELAKNNHCYIDNDGVLKISKQLKSEPYYKE